MAPYSTSETLNLVKEQRQERLQWVFFGVGSMLLVVCGFYMQQRVELRLLHAYGLTVLTYGALIYVEEFQHLKRLVVVEGRSLRRYRCTSRFWLACFGGTQEAR
jgi:hypothetical protein